MPNYVAILPGSDRRIDRRARLSNLEPARIGWTAIDDDDHTFCRRWIRRPDKMIEDPFGRRTVRANMHPGYQNPDVIGPAGPVDPGIDRAVGPVARRPADRRAGQLLDALLRRDARLGRLFRPVRDRDRQSDRGRRRSSRHSSGSCRKAPAATRCGWTTASPRRNRVWTPMPRTIARGAYLAYQAITYHDWVSLAMAETTLMLRRRVPDETRLAWARTMMAEWETAMSPDSLPEVYAKEAIFLHDEPRRELKLQAIRIGELGITAIPNEVFAITGLKLKAQSPFETTMNIELANGSEGYIPPPEQHALGGYTTWPAAHRGLEVQAEPQDRRHRARVYWRKVAGKPRRPLLVLNGPMRRPSWPRDRLAYWRLEDMRGAQSHATRARMPRWPPTMAESRFSCPGPVPAGLSAATRINRLGTLRGRPIEDRSHRRGRPVQRRAVVLERAAEPGSSDLRLPCLARDVQNGDQLGIGGTQVAPPAFLPTGTNTTKPLPARRRSRQSLAPCRAGS